MADSEITRNKPTMDNHPTIVKVDRAKMEALEELARTNMLISEGHTSLQELKGLETDYLVEREGKAAAAVDRVLEESEAAVTQAMENYETIKGLAADTKSLSSRVVDLFNAVKSVMERFDEKSALWLKNVQDREGKLDEAKRALLLQKTMLDNERKSLDERALALTDAEAKVAADREEAAKMFTIKEVK